MQNIYEGNITCNINDDYGHPNQLEILNYLYVPKGQEWLISAQHWAQNSTYDNADDTNLDGNWFVTNHDRANLIWAGGILFCTEPLETKLIFTLQTAPGYTEFTAYGANVGYVPYFHDDNPECIPDNLAVFSRLVFTHSKTPLPTHPYPLPEGET